MVASREKRAEYPGFIRRIPARALLMKFLYPYAVLTQSLVGNLLSIDYTGASAARKRFVHLLEKDRKLKEIMERTTNELREG